MLVLRFLLVSKPRTRAERGYTGLLEHIATANCLAPLFRDDEGKQLLFSLARHLEPQQQANFQSLARVVVRMSRLLNP